MKTKTVAVVISILLIVTLLGGCRTQSTAGTAAKTTASDTGGTTVDISNSDEPTADCIRTTPVEQIPSTADPTRTNATSTSGSTAWTSASTTFTTAAPTVHTLTPLAPSSYYGFSELQGLPNNAALTDAYERIVQAVQNCQTTVEMGEKLTESELLTVFYHYYADYPQHFWCDGSLRYSLSGQSKKVVQIQLQYTMTGDRLQQAQTDFKTAVIDLLEIAAIGNNEYERELLLHDALAKRITYQESDNAHNAYGALVEGKAVCEGYARAFQYVLYQSGIQCLIAEGSGIDPSTGVPEGHMWNVARIDGQYYHVDVTWDDTDDANTSVMYPYFNLTTAQIGEDHTISTKNGYSLPNCMATAANYHVRNGTRLTVCTVDGVAAVLMGKNGDVHLYCVGGSEAFVEWFQKNHGAVMQAIGVHHGYSYDLLCAGKEVAVRLTVKK